jgi:hypothetical protein
MIVVFNHTVTVAPQWCRGVAAVLPSDRYKSVLASVAGAGKYDDGRVCCWWTRLRRPPPNPSVKSEFTNLHLGCLEAWVTQRRVDATARAHTSVISSQVHRAILHVLACHEQRDHSRGRCTCRSESIQPTPRAASRALSGRCHHCMLARAGISTTALAVDLQVLQCMHPTDTIDGPHAEC